MNPGNVSRQQREPSVYTKNPAKDVLLFAKAVASNLVARWTPGFYVKLTRQTGRGRDGEKPEEIARYFRSCVNDYRDQLGLSDSEFDLYLRGKVVLEYGPGDILGVALLLIARGAERVHCVDRFPLSSTSDKNLAVYRLLIDSLEGEQRRRALAAFSEAGRPESGFASQRIDYLVSPNGLSGATNAYDLVISRAVLEHVNNLDDTMLDIAKSMKPTGMAVHQVDLKSHGLDRYVEFDFLTWPSVLYRLMYSHKGFPNRWRVDRYRTLAVNAGLKITRLTPTDKVEPGRLSSIQPYMAPEFRNTPIEELCWAGFWIQMIRGDA